MISAARKLQSLGFAILLLAIFGLIYPLSLQVATTRSDVLQIERDILRTRENIRYLETELGARASMRQLERWNADVFGYSAPTASQYLAGEQDLASMHNRTLDGGMPIVAPVLTAMTTGVPTSPDTIALPSVPAAGRVQGLAIAQRVDVPQPRMRNDVQAMRTDAVMPVHIISSAQAAPAKTKTTGGSQAMTPAALARKADQRRAERAAMLEGQLLSPDTVSQIERGAQIERRAAVAKSAVAKSAVVKSSAARATDNKLAAKAVTTKSVAKPAAAKPAPARPAVKANPVKKPQSQTVRP